MDSTAPSKWRCVVMALVGSIVGGGCGGAFFREAPQARTALAVCSLSHALHAVGHAKPAELAAADQWCAAAMRAAATEAETLTSRLQAAQERAAESGLGVPEPLAAPSIGDEPETPDAAPSSPASQGARPPEPDPRLDIAGAR